MSGITMVHIPFEKLFTTLETLYRELYLDSVCVEIHPAFTVCDTLNNGVAKVPDGRSIRVQFEHRGLLPQDNKNRIDFWKRLVAMGYRVVWKKGNKGYEIGQDGIAIDDWELDDGGC